MTEVIVVEHTTLKVASVVASIARRHNVAVSFTAADALVDAGMTSTAMVDLMLAVESEFDLVIPDNELTAENFSSIAALAVLLVRLRTMVTNQRIKGAPS